MPNELDRRSSQVTEAHWSFDSDQPNYNGQPNSKDIKISIRRVPCPRCVFRTATRYDNKTSWCFVPKWHKIVMFTGWSQFSIKRTQPSSVCIIDPAVFSSNSDPHQTFGKLQAMANSILFDGKLRVW